MVEGTVQGLPSPSTDPENPGGFVHIPALDGIRGMALLMVLYHHLFTSNTATGVLIFDFLSSVRTSCYLGVNLFFVLSGFLITGILLDARETPHYFKTFYARRILRIFPLYYGFLFVLLALTRPLHLEWSGWQYCYLTYTSNLFAWRRSAPLYLSFFNINHFWSLQVEEQFYLLWPLIVYRTKRAATLLKICAAGSLFALCTRIVLILLRHHHGFTNIYLPVDLTPACADNLLFGCALSVLLRSRWRTSVMRLAPRALACAAGVLLVVAVDNHGLYWADKTHPFSRAFIPTLGFSLVALSCACILAMALRPRSKTDRFFSSGFLRFLGKYSYGTYIFHYSIYGALGNPIRHYLDQQLHSKGLGVLLAGCVVGALSVLVAVISYNLYEVQFLKLKRYFSYDRAPASAVSP
jgi:peptidoglycan/LPS O-acetylase OafA/YrhL